MWIREPVDHAGAYVSLACDRARHYGIVVNSDAGIGVRE